MLRRSNQAILIAALMVALSASVFPLVSASAADSAQWVPQTSGTTSDLYAVWGSSPVDVFAVGKAGTILHYDGKAWTPVTGGGASDLHAIWGSSATDIFAVGKTGVILRYDGKAWAPMTGSGNVDLFAVWGSSSDNGFVVGKAGTILHYDGKAWTPVTGGGASDLHAIWGSSATDIFVVGKTGAILRYDGKAWAPMTGSGTVDLFAVWGSSSANVFAVGKAGAILHYDGKGWAPMTGSGTSDLYALWGSSSSDIFAVGSSGAIMHYDGKAWSPMTRNLVSDLHGLWGISSSDVLAGGSAGAIVRYAPPAVAAISPDQGSQGGTLEVTITGENLTGATEVRFGAGIAVNGFDIPGHDRIVVNITIVAGAATGARDISVITPGGAATLAGSFTVKQALPIISSVTPNQANQETTLNVIITGANFTGASAVNFGPGITTNNFAAPSSNQITANITVTAGAATGPRGVSITAPGGVYNLPDSFTVRQALPVLTMVSPNQGSRGATLDVTITGKNFTGATEVRFGLDIAVNRFTISNSGEIAANITIVATATTGTRAVSVTTPGGTSALPDSFVVKQGLPVISSVNPARGNPGDTLDVLINGSNLDGATAVSFGGEVAVNGFSNRSSTQIAARVTVSINAAAGVKDVSVTTGGGTGILAGSFTVNEGPMSVVFVALIWVGIALAVGILVIVIRTLRRKRVASL